MSCAAGTEQEAVGDADDAAAPAEGPSGANSEAVKEGAAAGDADADMAAAAAPSGRQRAQARGGRCANAPALPETVGILDMLER